MTLEIYLAYVLACVVITVVPGPTVTVIVANSLTHGTRAGLLNVLGTQIGLAVMLSTLLVGLSAIIATMGVWFDWLRFLGAAYLIWLGWKLIRSSGELQQTLPPRGGFVTQGLLVILSNPKGLLWFGAFIPQFIDPKGNYVAQIILLGLTAMATALVSDGAYAILVGRAGSALSKRRVQLVNRVGGGFLIGGGIWLALTRSR
jgi:threonine/homoserine/homoserine lactone efflux protein